MSLKLYAHPLSSFCHKALIALYERGTAFDFELVNLVDPDSRAQFEALWPMAKMPVLRDEKRGCTVAESTVVIEYLDSFYPGPAKLIPADPDLAWKTRMWDRFFDNYVHQQMQKITGDMLRPEGSHDPYGVEEAKTLIHKAYGIWERELGSRQWAMGADFTLADCSAAPALFYADLYVPASGAVSAYLDRLMARSSYARALKEAEPYFQMFPGPRTPRVKRG